MLPVFHRGLGKSLQALTALAVLRIEKNMNTAPFLVVCPASVALHWYDETKRFFPESLLCPLRFSELSASPGKDLQPASVVVVSYEMLRRDICLGPQRSVLSGRLWEAVVLDEAHLIKNPAAGTSKAVCALKSLHRIALSGTPVQNQVGMRRTWGDILRRAVSTRLICFFLQVEELWSLMQFLLPDYLGNTCTCLHSRSLNRP
jgi:SNF2 family DNA or RNA helicase